MLGGRGRSDLLVAEEVVAQGGSPGERQRQRGKQRHADGDRQSAEKHARDPGNRDQRQEDHDRRDGRSHQRNADLADGAADRLRARLARIAMHDDVFHHHDGIVDHQPDGRGQAAQGHQVEALAHDRRAMNVTADGRGNHQAGHQRRAPVAQEQHHDAARPASSPSRMASRTLLMESVTISDWS